jgi:hypothetical protein
MPILETTCTYFMPLRMSCWTRKRAFMRNVAPSLMVKGFLFRDSRAPVWVRSIMISERPSTSRPRESRMTLRGSLGSEMVLPLPRPRDSFHLRRDSSFWSVEV